WRFPAREVAGSCQCRATGTSAPLLIAHCPSLWLEWRQQVGNCESRAAAFSLTSRHVWQNRWGLRWLEASDSLLLTGGKRSVGCSRSILQSPSALSWPSFSGHCEVERRFHAAAATTQSAYASCASS